MGNSIIDDPYLRANRAQEDAIRRETRAMEEAHLAKRNAEMEKSFLVSLSFEESKGAALQSIDYMLKWAETQKDLTLREEEIRVGLKSASVGTADISQDWDSWAKDLKNGVEADKESFEEMGNVITWKGNDPSTALSKREKKEFDKEKQDLKDETGLSLESAKLGS